MRTDDKLERLLDMTEHPDRYSVEELTEMLDDKEAQDWTNMMVEVRAAAQSLSAQPTVETHAAAMPQPKWQPMWRKVAAAIAALFVLSGVAYAAWHLTHTSYSPQQPHTPQPEVLATHSTRPDSFGTVVLFDKVPLDSILGEVAGHYQKSVAFRSEALCSLRFHVEWDRADSLGAFTGLLNEFDGIHLWVENDTIFVEQE